MRLLLQRPEKRLVSGCSGRGDGRDVYIVQLVVFKAQECVVVFFKKKKNLIIM